MKMNNIKYLIKKQIEDKFIPPEPPVDKEMTKIKQRWNKLRATSSFQEETFTKEEEEEFKRTEQLASEIEKNPKKVIESMLLVTRYYEEHRKRQGLNGKTKVGDQVLMDNGS